MVVGQDIPPVINDEARSSPLLGHRIEEKIIGECGAGDVDDARAGTLIDGDHDLLLGAQPLNLRLGLLRLGKGADLKQPHGEERGEERAPNLSQRSHRHMNHPYRTIDDLKRKVDPPSTPLTLVYNCYLVNAHARWVVGQFARDPSRSVS